MIFRQNEELNKALESKFQARNEAQFALEKTISTHLAIPNLIGLWTMASADVANNGDCLDTSGAGRTLTNNNTVQFGYDGLIPYSKFVRSPSPAWLSRIDEAGTSIIGNEAYVVSGQNGFSMGGWFYFDNTTPLSFEVLIAKGAIAGGRSFEIRRNTAGTIRLLVSNDGTNIFTVDSASMPSANGYYRIDGTFIPSTEIAIYVDSVKDSNSTSIPATLFDSPNDFVIGGRSIGGNSLDGRASMCYLSASPLDFALIQNLYHTGKPLYKG